MILYAAIDHVPVVERDDGLYALGVPLWFYPPHRISDYPQLYDKIDAALVATSPAAPPGRQICLNPGVWLLRCRRCRAPFIDLPQVKLCSDECRAATRRDAGRRAIAKRTKRRAEARSTRTCVCRWCGVQVPASRSTKDFCSGRCRVAAHRDRELDRQIADMPPPKPLDPKTIIPDDVIVTGVWRFATKPRRVTFTYVRPLQAKRAKLAKPASAR